MKKFFLLIITLYTTFLPAQNTAYLHANFCKNLNKVFELGRKDNFDAYDGTMVKESPFLPVPSYSIQLNQFAINYVDKDSRFVAKTNLNMDSVSALEKFEQIKTYIGFCLDSTQWSKWSDLNGDDSTTVFFRELKEARTYTKDLFVTVAVVIAAPKVYTVSMYVKRR